MPGIYFYKKAPIYHMNNKIEEIKCNNVHHFFAIVSFTKINNSLSTKITGRKERFSWVFVKENASNPQKGNSFLYLQRLWQKKINM